MAYLSFQSQYNPFPKTTVRGSHRVWEGYTNILEEIQQKNAKIIVVDCYHGVDYKEISENFIEPFNPSLVICSDTCAYSAQEIKEKVQDHITDDRVFGVMSFHKLNQFFHDHKIDEAREQIKQTDGIIVVYGVGASLIVQGDILIYADITRWEIQLRFRKGILGNWQDDNFSEDILRRYKRGYFMEWRWMDEHKKSIFKNVHYYLDTNSANNPKMLCIDSYNQGLDQIVSQPFRLKPYFDPGVWGGQWMKEVCNIDPSPSNYAWAFDGVPEENSLLLQYNNIIVEIPAINLVFERAKKLLGERVFTMFGAEFPIRFDFLDTMHGQNLSLQVHPTTEYAYKNFGIRYTQDESYYILDAEKDAEVYLGAKEGINSQDMINDLKLAEKGEISFPDKKYINTFPCKKHDHFLIPAGTLHCSGSGSMVLEISTTPYIFTFKLWDWERVGLDGLPRPVHINHGEKVIDWSRTTSWVKNNLINQVTVIENNEHYLCERTGLHRFEFIDTYRFTIHSSVVIDTNDSVNMLNLIEGEEITVSCPDNIFLPMIIHYAETFIVPENCKKYKITPSGNSIGKSVKIIQAYIK